MNHAEQPPNPPSPAPPAGAVLCPYCGHASSNRKECDRCRGVFEPLSRQASQNAMGPWYIRDETNPFRPGCSYATIRALVARKRIDADTVLRGPSTRQFWLRARNTPGVAHLLGECHACHKAAADTAALCTHCGASFEVEDDRQFLGLAEVRTLPNTAAAARTTKPVAEAIVPPPIPTEPPSTQAERTPSRTHEPIRNPARGPRAATSMSDEQIEEMLRKGRAYDRANSSTRVVTILVALAVLGIMIAGGFAVALVLQNQAPSATNAPTTTPGTPPGATTLGTGR